MFGWYLCNYTLSHNSLCFPTNQRKEAEAQKAKDEMEKQRKRQAELDRKRALGITEDQNESEDNEKTKESGDDSDEEEDGEENEEEDEKVIHDQEIVFQGFYRGPSSDKFVITIVTRGFSMLFLWHELTYLSTFFGVILMDSNNKMEK